jgi:hypothetical protein
VATTRNAVFACAAALLLTVTLAADARADEAQSESKLVGGSLQFGSLAGAAEFRGELATAIGGRVGGFVRVGIATFGAEYDYLAVGHAPGRGRVGRLGATARLDVLRIDRRFGGPNSALVLWVDTSVGRQRGTWHDGTRISREDVSVGWGWLLEHRVRLSTRPRKLETIGWQFGWRLIGAPRYGDDLSGIAACARKTMCPGDTMRERHDLALVVNSSLSIDW